MRPNYTTRDVARLWSQIRIGRVDECWPWANGGTNGNGYGCLRVKDEAGRWRKVFSHRMVLEIAEGQALKPGEMACHHCDNRPCCNPAHLFRGDVRINAADMKAKGRSRKGERHRRSKLTDAQAKEMRELFATRMYAQADLAEKYGVSAPCVSEIIRGRKWTHAGGPIQPTHIRLFQVRPSRAA